MILTHKRIKDFLFVLFFRIETASPRISILHTKNLDVEEVGLVVDMNYFDTGQYMSVKVNTDQ